MIKIQNINNRELKNILDKYFEINLMISKIPKIKERLINYSKEKIKEMFPNEELINENFKFNTNEQFSLKPSSLKEKFIVDNEIEIRNILINYVTEYDFYEKNKNKILNDYICLFLINTYRFDNLILELCNIKDEKKEILNHRYCDNLNIYNKDMNYLINKRQEMLKKDKIKDNEIRDFSNYVLNSFYDDLSTQLFTELLSQKYSKDRLKYINKININNFDSFKLINENIIEKLIKHIDEFLFELKNRYSTVYEDQINLVLNEYENDKEKFIYKIIKMIYLTQLKKSTGLYI